MIPLRVLAAIVLAGIISWPYHGVVGIGVYMAAYVCGIVIGWNRVP